MKKLVLCLALVAVAMLLFAVPAEANHRQSVRGHHHGQNVVHRHVHVAPFYGSSFYAQPIVILPPAPIVVQQQPVYQAQSVTVPVSQPVQLPVQQVYQYTAPLILPVYTYSPYTLGVGYGGCGCDGGYRR